MLESELGAAGGELVLVDATKKEGQRAARIDPETAESRSRDGHREEALRADGVDMKRNPHIGRRLDEFIGEQRAKDPEFRAQFDRLELARKVKKLREKKKMTQLRLAVLAGTQQPNIARLESGKVVPKLDLLEKVARALGGRLDVRIVDGK